MPWAADLHNQLGASDLGRPVCAISAVSGWFDAAEGGLVTGLGSELAVRRRQRVTLALCWAVLVVEGYDIVVYGAAVPALLEVDAWELGAREIGFLGSVALVGDAGRRCRGRPLSKRPQNQSRIWPPCGYAGDAFSAG